MAKDVKGITILVTGSAEGIGFSMVDNFLKNGAKFAILLDINEQKGMQAIETLKSKYSDNKAVFFKCDVTKDLEDIFNKVISKYGYVDLVINNAGVCNEKDYNITIDVNITAVIAWSMKFYDFMRKDKSGKGGSIINVSSVYGYRITPCFSYYQASKFAVMGFSKSLGHQINFKRTGVRVVTVCPGLTRTSLCANLKNRVREIEFVSKVIEETEAEVWQSPDDIGKGTVEIFLQAESGEAWLVDGKRPAEKLNI